MSSSRRSKSRRLRQILANLLVVLLGLVALVLLVGLFLPRDYRVERSIEIKARPDTVFADLATLRRWPEWTAWNRGRDPQVEFQFEGPESGVGATYRWNGPVLGRGQLRLTRSNPTNGIAYEVSMDNGEYTSVGTLSLKAGGESVLVTWSDEGRLGRNPLLRYVGLMIDSMIGPDFEKGLANLKSRAEGIPGAPEVAAPAVAP